MAPNASKLAWFSGESGFDALLTLGILMSAVSLRYSKYQSRAPYGRFGSESKHLSLDPRLGWWLMELPATLCFLHGFRQGMRKLALRRQESQDNKASGETSKERRPSHPFMRAMFFLWFLRHYANRGWYFPLTIRVAEGGKASFALFNSAIGAIFVGAHGYMHGRLFSDVGSFQTSWLRDPRFIVGAALFESGFWTIVHSESVLRNLRPAGRAVPAAERYKIPYGGMFKYVTNPQYLGEIMAWSGLLTMTWSPTAIPVLFITLANLVPRAFENHKWYLEKFPDYPKDRKALIPWLA